MLGTLIALLLYALMFASTAHAQEPAGRIHIALEGTLLSYSQGTLELGDGDEQDTEVFRSGYPSSVGARVGYLPLSSLEFGATFAFEYESHEDGDGWEKDEYSTGSHQVAAYARYIAPGNRARFFIGPTLGGEFVKQDDPGEDGDDDLEIAGRSFVLGLDAGIYGFFTDSFSIDPVLSFSYSTGSLEVDDDFETEEFDVSGFQVALGVSLSGWVPTR
jgi:hypothetical protein